MFTAKMILHRGINHGYCKHRPWIKSMCANIDFFSRNTRNNFITVIKKTHLSSLIFELSYKMSIVKHRSNELKFSNFSDFLFRFERVPLAESRTKRGNEIVFHSEEKEGDIPWKTREERHTLVKPPAHENVLSRVSCSRATKGGEVSQRKASSHSKRWRKREHTCPEL